MVERYLCTDPGEFDPAYLEMVRKYAPHGNNDVVLAMKLGGLLNSALFPYPADFTLQGLSPFIPDLVPVNAELVSIVGIPYIEVTARAPYGYEAPSTIHMHLKAVSSSRELNFDYRKLTMVVANYGEGAERCEHLELLRSRFASIALGVLGIPGTAHTSVLVPVALAEKIHDYNHVNPQGY